MQTLKNKAFRVSIQWNALVRKLLALARGGFTVGFRTSRSQKAFLVRCDKVTDNVRIFIFCMPLIFWIFVTAFINIFMQNLCFRDFQPYHLSLGYFDDQSLEEKTIKM
ncbi:hypothetical protein [Helicobacter pylori]|uniref:hypothetical protein n=1 Tax=Helicobacter pylori TaxID=210 RepID=UPI003C73EB44